MYMNCNIISFAAAAIMNNIFLLNLTNQSNKFFKCLDLLNMTTAVLENRKNNI